MRKFTSSFLSLLILLNTFGFNLAVMSMLTDNYSENLELIEEHPESIPSEKIVTFSLKNDKIHILNEHEISYADEMYDIILKKDTGDDILIYCVSDKKDTQLHTVFRSLNDLSDNPLSVPDNFVSTILKNLLKNYLPPDGNNGAAEIISQQLYGFTDLPPQSVIPEKIYPPPQA